MGRERVTGSRAIQTPRTLLAILLAGAAVFYLVFIFRTAFPVGGKTYFTLIDDAMISMRYARNLAEGNGLLWNAGGPPVEGFTNLGWTLIMALVHLLPLPQPTLPLAVMLIGAAILIGNIIVVYRIAGALDPAARFAPVIAAGATAFYFPLVFWTLRGLEVGALALSIGAALLLAIRNAAQPKPARTIWLTLALGTALLIRMDAALPVGLILILLASKAPRAAIAPAITAILVLGAILLFQKSYFGDFLPNTYYLKVAGVSPWERIRVGFSALVTYASRDFLMPLFVAVLGLVIYRDMRGREAALLLALFLGQAMYSVWVGGDYAEELVNSANRFIAPAMTALIVLFSLVLERAIRSVPDFQPKAGLALLIGLGAVIVMSGEPWYRWALTNAPMLRTDIQRAKLGLHVKEYTDPAAVIAVHAAGQIPYYSERTTIDLLGKSDPIIAKGKPATGFVPGHNKWNYEYSILQLRPDVIADNFNKLRGFMEDQPEYVLLPNGIYVRSDSGLVDVKGLSADYR